MLYSKYMLETLEMFKSKLKVQKFALAHDIRFRYYVRMNIKKCVDVNLIVLYPKLMTGTRLRSIIRIKIYRNNVYLRLQDTQTSASVLI